jgi:hypothetical protein
MSLFIGRLAIGSSVGVQEAKAGIAVASVVAAAVASYTLCVRPWRRAGH